MRVKLELLTIILKSLQILSSFFLAVVLFSYFVIKVKTKKNRSKDVSFSNSLEGKNLMTYEFPVTANDVSMNIQRNEQKTLKRTRIRSTQNNKFKVYAVYNNDSNPNFYLNNKLYWYKNFD
jgi:hypothetical protein